MNTTDLTRLPARPNLDQYKKQAKDRLKSTRMAGHGEPATLATAQLEIAHEHGFASWPKFAAHLNGLARTQSTVSRFEAAADAVVSGDAATLERLLTAHPELIHARSTRVHGAMLLHYIGANGFENWRQKTPPNAVEILRILLRAGAEVDATGAMYGLGTTLGLVATSVWPKLAGVQNELLQVLIDAGASPDGAPGGWNPLDSALSNGRPEAAVFLAEHGARVSFTGAAGIGRLDLLQRFFASTTPTQRDLDIGLAHACQYGRAEVIGLLLEHGADLRFEEGTGMPPLHWAIIGDQVEVVKLLLIRGADVTARNAYGGTALGACEWRANNGGDPNSCAAIFGLLRVNREQLYG
ncbi:MAG: ankyrin repeat domain-containing protein [Acidobacteriota bacterium]